MNNIRNGCIIIILEAGGLGVSLWQGQHQTLDEDDAFVVCQAFCLLLTLLPSGYVSAAVRKKESFAYGGA